MTDLTSLIAAITLTRKRFTDVIQAHADGSGLTIDAYHRYLSMQYHLTKDVQRYFLVAAAHADLSKMRRLRRFLYDFANEEELHYLVAAKDVQALGRSVLPEPFDVQLWHAYFIKEVVSRPFVRLGAASVLENLASTENRPMFAQLLKAPFLSLSNTKFLVLHMHESLPHGDQILDALRAETLSQRQEEELLEGAWKAGVMYLRMVEGALNPEAPSRCAAVNKVSLSAEERDQIERFSVAEIGL